MSTACIVRLISFVSILLLLSVTDVSTRTWKVMQGGVLPPLTIQAGIDSSSNGDTVLVGPGHYFENIDFRSKNIEVKSESGSMATVIDGSANHLPCVRIIGGQTHAAVLAGFTLTGGRGMPQGSTVGAGSGGGILIFESEPTIRDNIIEGNEASYEISTGDMSGAGGGISCRYMTLERDWSPIILNNVVRDNRCGAQGGGIYVRGPFSPIIVGNIVQNNEVTTGDGGGIFVCVQHGDVRITDNLVLDNRAADHGGGVVVCSEIFGREIPATISGNVIARNYAGGSSGVLGSGGGIYLTSTSAWVHHNTIVMNEGAGKDSTLGGGVTIDKGSPLVELNIIALSVDGGSASCVGIGDPVFRNNLIWQNKGDLREAVCSWDLGLNGNLAEDPLFCDVANGIYSLAQNSPGIGDTIIGAFHIPGCPARVPTLPTTWGAIKALFMTSSTR